MSDELLGVDISRNYDTWDEALNDLYNDHEQDSNISEVFRCLEESEKPAQEIEEELDIGHSPSSYLTRLYHEGFVYKLGPQDPQPSWWGAEVEEVQSDEYRTDVGKS